MLCFVFVQFVRVFLCIDGFVYILCHVAFREYGLDRSMCFFLVS